MVGATDHFVFAMLMTLFTGGFGGMLLIIAWVQILLEPPTDGRIVNRIPLYVFTASICAALAGAALASVLPDSEKTSNWTFALVISFACAAISMLQVRKSYGPERRAVQIGSIGVFIVDLIGLIGMIMALPGMPLNQMGK